MSDIKLNKSLQGIYDFMEANDGITQAQAFLDLGVGRLSARIFDLREKGVPIAARMIQVKKKDGSVAFVAKYSIGREEQI